MNPEKPHGATHHILDQFVGGEESREVYLVSPSHFLPLVGQSLCHGAFPLPTSESVT